MSKNVFDLEVKVKQINEVGSELEAYTATCYSSTCYSSTCYSSTCYSSTCYTGQQMCGYTYTTSC